MCPHFVEREQFLAGLTMSPLQTPLQPQISAVSPIDTTRVLMSP